MGVGGVDCGSKACVFVVIWPRIATIFEGSSGTIMSCVKGGVDFMLREGWGYCVGLTAMLEAEESIAESQRG